MDPEVVGVNLIRYSLITGMCSRHVYGLNQYTTMEDKQLKIHIV